MANIHTESGHKINIAATGSGNYILGDGSDGLVSTFAVQVVNGGGLSATIIVKARIRGKEASDDNIAFLPVNYLSVYVNAVTGTQGYVLTTLTTNSLILIPSTGMTISLEVVYTSGAGTIYWWPLEGAAA